MPDGHRLETLLQHLGEDDHYCGAVAPPIAQTSLFVFDTVADFRQSFEYKPGTFNYSRIKNPTNDLAEQKIAAMEGCEAAHLFSSGMAAISAGILSCVQSGGHVVAVDTLYGPTRNFLSDYGKRLNIEVTYVVGEDPADFEKAARPNTQLVYLESPSSLLFRLQDLKAVADWAKSRGVATMIDNSYSSPWFQSPATFGIDIVAHSASKYLGGHSDVVAGALATSRERMDRMIKDEIALFGGTLAPFPAWLILRSLRTLPIKMKAHESAANEVAAWLTGRAWCEAVYHVGLADHPQADLRDIQMRGTGGLFSFRPSDQDPDRLTRFVESLKVFQLGVSWGGYESLVVPIETHPMDWSQPGYIVRLFCGLEHPEDLISDLEQAAAAAGWTS